MGHDDDDVFIIIIIIVKHDLPVLGVGSVFSVSPSVSTIQLASELKMSMVARMTPVNDMT